MAAQGAKIVISSRKSGTCEQAAEAINASGDEAIAVPCNISEDEQLETLVSDTLMNLPGKSGEHQLRNQEVFYGQREQTDAGVSA